MSYIGWILDYKIPSNKSVMYSVSSSVSVSYIWIILHLTVNFSRDPTAAVPFIPVSFKINTKKTSVM